MIKRISRQVPKIVPTAGGVVVGPEGKIVVVSQQGTSWSLPKGKIEPGESALEAARREIYEETGISQLLLVIELGTYQRHRRRLSGRDDQSEVKQITMFLFTTKQQALQPLDPKNPEALWVEQDQVSKVLTHPKDKEFFYHIKHLIGSARTSGQ